MSRGIEGDNGSTRSVVNVGIEIATRVYAICRSKGNDRSAR